MNLMNFRTMNKKLLAMMCFAFMIFILSSCAKENEELVELPQIQKEDPYYISFAETGELVMPDVDLSKFSARSVRVKGDTIFIANNHADDRSILIINLKENKLIGKISRWTRGGVDEKFDAEIGDMAVSDHYIFVGMHNSRINIFERRSMRFVNVIGRSDGGWGSGIYDMVHCFGLREYADRLVVRDKETIRVYWLYEALTEPAFRVPWLGKINVPEGLGYDYQPTQHGFAEYKGKVYLDDWYQRAVQVVDPSKMEIKFAEESLIDRDTVFNYPDIRPSGLAASGGSMFMSLYRSGVVNRYDIKTGTFVEKVADFTGREVGRMELANDLLYFIDNKTAKIFIAKGVKR